MERRGPDTMPLPVVETVAAPGPPPTAAMPVEPPLTAAMPVEPPPEPLPRRDMTPWLLGILAFVAVVALGLSALAFSRDDPPAAPVEPVGTEEPATTLPFSEVPPSSTPLPPATPTPGPAGAAPASSVAPVTTAAAPVPAAPPPQPAPGKGKGGGKNKP